MATTCFGGCARWKASLKERPGPPLRIRQSPVLPCAPGLHRSEDDGYTAANSGEAGEPSYRLRAGAQRMLLGPVCRVAVSGLGSPCSGFESEALVPVAFTLEALAVATRSRSAGLFAFQAVAAGQTDPQCLYMPLRFAEPSTAFAS